MKNSTLITITTIDGTKQYTITQLIKKFIFFFLFMLIVVIVGVFVFITYLNSLVKERELEMIKRDKIIYKKNEKIKFYESQKKILESKILFLEKNITNLESEILKKEKFLEDVNDRVADIERIINYTPPKSIKLEDRLNFAKMDLIDKKFILENVPNGYPVVYRGITSNFGWRKHPIYKNKREFHTGLDMKAKMNTPVYATADGIVEYANFHKRSGYGNLLIISHNFGFKTLFGHLNKIVVKQGEFVKKGQLVAYTGNSGLSSGPHLHYEIRYIGVVLNPTYFLKWNLKNYKLIFEKERKVKWQSLIKAMKYQKQLIQQQLSQKVAK
jgi:murein DD-endopeptidase MepM/ murein hydrolase activator NlpD